MIKPTGEKLFIEKIESEKEVKTDSGIILTKQRANKDLSEGIVKEIGPNVKFVKKDMKVFFEEQASYDIIVRGKIYSVVNEASVLAFEEE